MISKTRALEIIQYQKTILATEYRNACINDGDMADILKEAYERDFQDLKDLEEYVKGKNYLNQPWA